MKRGLFLMLLAVVLMLGTEETAQAAVATIDLQTESETVRVGDEFEVTLLITALPVADESPKAAIIGDFEAYLIYNADVLEFVTAPPCITGGAGMLRIMDMGAGASEGNRKYVIKFKALERGVSDLSLDSRPIVYTYGMEQAMSVSSNVLTLAVEASVHASDNANLSALKVNPGKISPTFATTIREYEVTVPYESEMIVVSALTEDENATVGVNGSTGLRVGRNTVTVTVTAEDGTEKRYYLFVTREKEKVEPTKAPEPPKEKEEFEAGIHAELKDGVTELTVAGRFKVSDEPGAYIAPTGYEETVLYVDGVQTKAYVKRDAPESDFFVLVLEDELGNSGYYRYDREQATIQRFDEERVEIRQVLTEDNSSLYEALDKYKSRQVILLFVLAMFFAFTVLLLLIVVSLLRQRHTDENELDGH
ncbi:MAG: cadherin-like beta sandwich domain-containing protein [Lachnospiraceae bacterium]|nr:cadherin-like beta sandwich domain-containing protein [Lachnospiraceae bacterium]